MALTKQGPVFSLSSVYIKAPTEASGTWVRIPAIHNASYKGSVTEVELTGDNQIIGVLRHSQKGVITVKANYAAMAVIEKVSGNTGVVSGAGLGSMETLNFGTLAELNPPIMAVKALMPINRTDGTTGTLVGYWYKTQVSTAFEGFPGGAYGAVTEISLTFQAFRTQVDENNTALNGDARGPASGCFGRIEFNDGILT